MIKLSEVNGESPRTYYINGESIELGALYFANGLIVLGVNLLLRIISWGLSLDYVLSIEEIIFFIIIPPLEPIISLVGSILLIIGLQNLRKNLQGKHRLPFNALFIIAIFNIIADFLVLSSSGLILYFIDFNIWFILITIANVVTEYGRFILLAFLFYFSQKGIEELHIIIGRKPKSRRFMKVVLIATIIQICFFVFTVLQRFMTIKIQILSVLSIISLVIYTIFYLFTSVGMFTFGSEFRHITPFPTGKVYYLDEDYKHDMSVWEDDEPSILTKLKQRREDKKKLKEFEQKLK